MSFDSFLFIIKRAISNIFRNIVLSLASVSILTACLLIFGVTIMLSENVTSFIDGVGGETRVVVYLEDGLTDTQISEYGKKLAQIDNIVKDGIVFESKEQALENYKKTYSGEEYDDINASLDADIFRNSYIFEVEDLSKFDQTVYEVGKIEGGAEINERRDIVKKLNDVKSIVSFLFSCIMVFLFVISIFVITNSVKASVYARKDEIAIMKYVGATDLFIKLPFFIEGLIIGVVAGMLSNLLLVAVYNGIISPILAEIDFVSPVNISAGHGYLTAVFILGGGLVGVLGSVLPVKKYLKV